MKEAATVVDELGGVEAVRERLQRMRAEIVQLYEQDLKAGQGASDEASDDIVDRANNAYNRELMFSISDGERQTLILLEEALRRLDQGVYGVCSHCSRPIGAARLEAVPSAVFCIDCQELAEQGLLEE